MPYPLVTLDEPLYKWVKKIAKTQGISLSLAMRDLIKKEFMQEAWYWTESWQATEREADEDLRKGRYRDFDSVEDLLDDLKS